MVLSTKPTCVRLLIRKYIISFHVVHPVACNLFPFLKVLRNHYCKCEALDTESGQWSPTVPINPSAAKPRSPPPPSSLAAAARGCDWAKPGRCRRRWGALIPLRDRSGAGRLLRYGALRGAGRNDAVTSTCGDAGGGWRRDGLRDNGGSAGGGKWRRLYGRHPRWLLPMAAPVATGGGA
jgi:hypothetical protein